MIYRVYDNYELDMELLGSGTYEECKRIAEERFNDTDGECYIILIDENDERYLI